MSLNTSPRMRLDSVIMAVSQLPFAATDCALPMIWARQNRVKASAFVTYTDNETWAGNIHPAQALRQYRDEFVGDAKAVVVGITSNGFLFAEGEPKE
jgi:60 kDa SS-A/Ro ribonucleoprotein